MTARRKFLQSASLFGMSWLLPGSIKELKAAPLNLDTAHRNDWYRLLYKISKPVLEPMSSDQLKLRMQVEYSPAWDGRDKSVAYMEAFGRLVAGLSPWISLPEDKSEEGKLRAELLAYLLKAHTHAVNPASKDYLTWHKEGQPLVDAAFIAHSFLRAPKQTWEPLDSITKKRYIEHFVSLRRVRIPYNNWLLFAAMLETFLFSIGETYDPSRIDFALRKHEEWYAGDGWFKDGLCFTLIIITVM